MIQQQPHTETGNEEETDAPMRANRRGLNLSLADRARGGKNSAKQQRRDSSGRFAGAVKHKEQAAGTGAKSQSGSSHRAGIGRGRFEAAARSGSATGLKEADDEGAGKHGRNGVMWVEREERILQEM